MSLSVTSRAAGSVARSAGRTGSASTVSYRAAKLVLSALAAGPPTKDLLKLAIIWVKPRMYSNSRPQDRRTRLQWLAELLAIRFLGGSFVPPRP